MKYYGEPQEIIPKMREMIDKKQGFWLTVTGNSMMPTLEHMKSSVYISPFCGRAKKGKIYLSVFGEHHCLLHRVIRCEGEMLYYKGDALVRCEGPIPLSDTIGEVTKIQKSDRIFLIDNPVYRFCNRINRFIYWIKRGISRFMHRVISRMKQTGGRSF